MILYDQHVHSRHSFDSPAEPRAQVEAALARGLAGITFTEHYDTHPEDWPTCRYDAAAYHAEVEVLRTEYGPRIWIGKGIEVCFQPDRMEPILALLREQDFDAVLLSVHWTACGAVHHREAWARHTARDMAHAYLVRVREAVDYCVGLHEAGRCPFHILGHLDLYRRYAQRFLGTDEAFGPEEAPLVDDILGRCLRCGLVPEINTSGRRQGLAEPMPGAGVLRRYAALGGRAIALGSDAHFSPHVGADLERAAALARHCGLTELAVFQRGRRTTLPL